MQQCQRRESERRNLKLRVQMHAKTQYLSAFNFLELFLNNLSRCIMCVQLINCEEDIQKSDLQELLNCRGLKLLGGVGRLQLRK